MVICFFCFFPRLTIASICSEKKKKPLITFVWSSSVFSRAEKKSFFSWKTGLEIFLAVVIWGSILSPYKLLKCKMNAENILEMSSECTMALFTLVIISLENGYSCLGPYTALGIQQELWKYVASQLLGYTFYRKKELIHFHSKTGTIWLIAGKVITTSWVSLNHQSRDVTYSLKTHL